MKILVENWQEIFNVSEEMEKLIRKSITTALETENFKEPSVVNVILVDNDQILEVNLEQRSINKPTDVLSFPMLDIKDGKILSNDGDIDYDEGLLILGDIMISMEKVKQQADEYGHSFDRELAFLTTHGIFHLLGYDHMSDEEEKIMIGKQEEVLNRINLGRCN